MDDLKNKDKKESNSLLWILISIVIVIIVLSWWGIDHFIPNNDTRGQFGDKFGSVNALFSGLAFAGLIYTIVLQRKDLNLQRKDLELTRNELIAQKEEAVKQNRTLLKQEFNTMFFNLLTANREIINEMQYSNIYGQSLLKYMYSEFKGNLARDKTNDKIKTEYTNIFNAYREHLSYYYRSLYRIIKTVKDCEVITRNEKYDYLNILVNQLSDYELILLFYDCIYRDTENNIKNSIEDYSLFNRFPYDLLIINSHKNGYFNEKAFARYRTNIE